MEKGQIRVFAGHSSGGTIADGQGRIISFDSSSIVARDRVSLRVGDAVWFERMGVKAINIRRG